MVVPKRKRYACQIALGNNLFIDFNKLRYSDGRMFKVDQIGSGRTRCTATPVVCGDFVRRVFQAALQPVSAHLIGPALRAGAGTYGVMSVTSPEQVRTLSGERGTIGHVFVRFGPACTTQPTDQGQFYELLHILLVFLLYISKCSMQRTLCSSTSSVSRKVIA
ncbi:hypothetical protein GWI33_003583 [Rhynchophorus ferrugineus]|uniref:Uncharacterized protein n=1 Tax=Rhynchophorus ferrugineus TaxID=354439 RepID=A0A834LX09_RHYFE|nr:hypothetical protein GWI33_003584 [Rhynchophorus ferrugineus]KAF7263126.1 hypothetical protein GWI33_003583 [Rhynchophorus ferrugineus]